MIHRCANCSGISGIQTFVERNREGIILENDYFIVYKHWISTDRTSLEESTKPTKVYLDILIQEIEKLKTHHFVDKNKSNYLKDFKEILKSNEATNIPDFAENYSFVVQGKYTIGITHRLHTLHPFTVYYRGDESKLWNTNFCVISDATNTM